MTVIYMPKQSNGTVHSSKDLNQLIDYVINPEKTSHEKIKFTLIIDKSVDRYEDYQQEHTKNKSQHSTRL